VHDWCRWGCDIDNLSPTCNTKVVAADGTTSNHKLATLLGTILQWCASHKLALSVRDTIPLNPDVDDPTGAGAIVRGVRRVASSLLNSSCRVVEFQEECILAQLAEAAEEEDLVGEPVGPAVEEAGDGAGAGVGAGGARGLPATNNGVVHLANATRWLSDFVTMDSVVRNLTPLHAMAAKKENAKLQEGTLGDFTLFQAASVADMK
jgi:hypothetical protein